MIRRSSAPRIAVIGGGVSGLAAAYRLFELDPTADLLLLEAAPRLGGVLETVRREGLLMEGGADGFLTAVPYALDLVRRIGWEDRLISPQAESRHTYVVRRGRLRKIPDGLQVMAPSRLWPMAATPILSLRGKLRAVRECFIPPKTDQADESLAAFAIRRFGREFFDRLVQPLTAGICAGEPEKISVHAALPRFVQMEREHGSLIRAVWRQKSLPKRQPREGGGPSSVFAAPREGMSSMIAALAARLPRGTVHVKSPVEALTPRAEGGWRLTIGGPYPREVTVDAVMVAAPAPAAARLLASLDAELAGALGGIAYADAASVYLAYRREQIPHPLNGYGVVVPRAERRRILSASFVSRKYAGRAPEEVVLLRAFFGGALAQELLDLPDRRLQQTAAEEIAELLRARGRPFFAHTIRRRQAMPQYYLGHGERVRRIAARAARWPGLALAGNAYHGAGIPQCIHSGETAAEALLARLQGVARVSG